MGFKSSKNQSVGEKMTDTWKKRYMIDTWKKITGREEERVRRERGETYKSQLKEDTAAGQLGRQPQISQVSKICV